MPALKMGGKGPARAMGSLISRNSDFSKGLFGNQVDPDLAMGGGASVPVMNPRPRIESAAPPRSSVGAKGGRF